MTDELVESMVASEGLLIADSSMHSNALSSLVEDKIENAILRYTRELSELVIEEERTLNEDTLIIASAIIDQQIKSVALESTDFCHE